LPGFFHDAALKACFKKLRYEKKPLMSEANEGF
jgi:hypothetical protein